MSLRSLVLASVFALTALACGPALAPEPAADAGDDAGDHCCPSASQDVLPDCDLRHNDICQRGDVDGGYVCTPRVCVQHPVVTR